MAGLIKEVWLNELIPQDFWQLNWFFQHGKNMDKEVDNDIIHWGFRGSASNVVKVNTIASYPLPVATRTDLPDYTPLDNYATERRRVHAIEQIGLSYDKLKDCVEQDRNAIIEAISAEGLWNVGPSGNTSKTPVITTPVTNPLGLDSYRLITAKEISELRTRLMIAYPNKKMAPWVLVLDAYSFHAMIATDPVLNNQYALNKNTGTIGSDFVSAFGFEIQCDTRTPWYNTGLSKLAWGSNPILGTDMPSAVAYVKQESFFEAMGTPKMFTHEDDPAYQSDTYSFLVRAKIGTLGSLIGNEQLLGAIARAV